MSYDHRRSSYTGCLNKQCTIYSVFENDVKNHEAPCVKFWRQLNLLKVSSSYYFEILTSTFQAKV